MSVEYSQKHSDLKTSIKDTYGHTLTTPYNQSTTPPPPSPKESKNKENCKEIQLIL